MSNCLEKLFLVAEAFQPGQLPRRASRRRSAAQARRLGHQFDLWILRLALRLGVFA